MASRRKLERAKKRFLAASEDCDWLQAVGIGLVDEQPGLVISVRPGAKSSASRLLNRLELDVPVTLRAIEKIRAREPATESADREARSMQALRDAALARFKKSHD